MASTKTAAINANAPPIRYRAEKLSPVSGAMTYDGRITPQSNCKVATNPPAVPANTGPTSGSMTGIDIICEMVALAAKPVINSAINKAAPAGACQAKAVPSAVIAQQIIRYGFMRPNFAQIIGPKIEPAKLPNVITEDTPPALVALKPLAACNACGKNVLRHIFAPNTKPKLMPITQIFLLRMIVFRHSDKET